MRIIMMMTICICMTSLFVRVMSDAVENLSNSRCEKPSTLVKTAVRRSRAMPAPVRAEMRPTRMVANAPRRVRRSIMPPILRR